MYFLAIHSVAGMAWGEWAAIAAVVAAVWAGGAKVAKMVSHWSREMIEEVVNRVTKPVILSVDRLSDMTKLAQHRTDERLAEHDQEIGKHNREIGELYGTVGLARRGRSDDREN